MTKKDQKNVPAEDRVPRLAKSDHITYTEVQDTGVIEILSRENCLVQVSRMSIRNRVLPRIPPAITQIQTSHEGYVVVDKA